ncbi:MAG: hypothetical protein Q8842_02775, partial [Candidatus Phytoplasma australasiaticum]|nr:hypothetical protein [Candidatus Phytoplasma australasiaticum]
SETKLSLPRLKIILEKLSVFISKEIINFNIQKNDFNKIILDLQKKISEKENDCRVLSSVRSVYPRHIQKLIEILNEKLSDFYNLSVFIYPLCELIDINDNLWRNAIEGFLGNRKFNLLIEENYFDQALKIYRNLPQSLELNTLKNFREISFGEPPKPRINSTVLAGRPSQLLKPKGAWECKRLNIDTLLSILSLLGGYTISMTLLGIE